MSEPLRQRDILRAMLEAEQARATRQRTTGGSVTISRNAKHEHQYTVDVPVCEEFPTFSAALAEAVSTAKMLDDLFPPPWKEQLVESAKQVVEQAKPAKPRAVK
jgi:hypothetical protein